MSALLHQMRGPLGWAALVSVGVNLLMLVSPVFMMQVFDRVLPSGHHETLYVLTALALVALAVLGAFDALRQTIMVRAGDWLERWLGGRLVAAALWREGAPIGALREVGQLRGFVASQGVFALLDAPWILVFGAVLWWMHPWLGGAAAVGALLLLAIALLSEALSRRLLVDAATRQGENQAALAAMLRGADAVRAMGMAERLTARWQRASHAALDRQRLAAERSAGLTGSSKTVRLGVQVAVLALGALLVLDGSLTAGGMIAASILLGRCLAPAEQAIAAWKGFVLARAAYRTLAATELRTEIAEPMELAPPVGELSVDGLGYAPQPGSPPILQGIGFAVRPGECVAVVGPSGSGKTTLCRLLVGALAPVVGEVRLDGRPVDGWKRAQLGAAVGYLPQGVELLPGTLGENIARFADAEPAAIVEAAARAGADRLIRGLPDGYDTNVGVDAVPLSMGQLQRIGLARAMFARPRVLVLDEPNANLDTDGERALTQAIRDSRTDGAAIVVVTHRASLLEVADKVLVLREGRVTSFGPRDEVIRPVAIADTPAPQAGEALRGAAHA